MTREVFAQRCQAEAERMARSREAQQHHPMTVDYVPNGKRLRGRQA